MNEPSEPDATAPHVPAATSLGAAPELHAPVPAAVHERYQLGEELARGGMGVVYRAADRVFDREVAVKVLGPELVGTAAAARFFEEARITAQLQHPAIPPVHDLGTLPDGRPFLAMKLVKGDTLAKRLKARETLADDLDHFAAVFERVCEAVAFAHSRGVIHRDLKPQNVMVAAFGEVQVMDWGLARSARGRVGERPLARVADRAPGAESDRTRAGQVMGTPAYMPPEQARGETERVTERSDVFALGCILCLILTGQPPYTGAHGREVLEKARAADLAGALARLTAATEELATLDEAVRAGPLIALARKCLRADPAERPAHAGEVAVQVRAARAKAQQFRTEERIERAVADVERAYAPARSGVLSALGCGLRILFVLAVGVLVLFYIFFVRLR